MNDDEVLMLAQTRMVAAEPLERDLAVAVDAAVERIRVKVVKLCTGWFSGDRPHAEDVVQESLAIAWQRLPEIRLPSFQAFVIGVARNRQRSGYRKISERLQADFPEVAGELHDGLAVLRNEEQEEVLLDAMADLPQDEQIALYLQYVDGLSVDAITRQLGLHNRSGARSVLVRARRHLSQRLRDALAYRGHSSSFFRTSIG
ncbi:MAG: sigma-70 family RNA polymerase sigma factor [Myxococcota bacterium]